ncbi:hypothetical protein P175DRAFT_0433135 [Aspergillus ochraceoroseus IBT 24754]|uniref:DUF1754-domain-containing protein n=1 Tax=Aspergillus ochraceoroseus IBT 24754 TaxID=1392256 RepID=A0A2T5M3J0_9EURO|nr:uncharacterized protein P175DRAFT_0433135 [Aspergillus ochraceoroseus IBT 24754]PTU23111.1 hypothetical protein P175DRAFT_0433135 [Aspergillus ochraceoroseus IBT 24754]
MDAYSTGGGGKLKLKGSKVSDGRVKKKKKKSKKAISGAGSDTGTPVERESDAVPDEREEGVPGTEVGDGVEREDRGEGAGLSGKTEAERRHEEMRRKRLQERLKRDGAKTHKERVEELNKYLSRLSEHHDMYGFLYYFILISCLKGTVSLTCCYRPKIGPG